MREKLTAWGRWPALPGLLAVSCAGAVHLGILGEFFADDDFVHLFRIVNNGFREFILTPHCGHTLVTRNALFYLFHWLFGLEAYGYFAVVLLTHLVNVFLVFRVLRRFTARPWLSSFVAALWGTSPIAVGTLSWYSVYGHSLVATTLLWILDEVSRLDPARPSVPTRTLLRWYGLLLLASNLFGVGVAVAMAAGPALYCLLPHAESRGRVALAFSSLMLVVPALYVGLQWVYTASYGGSEAQAMRPPFDSDGLRLVFVTTAQLVAYGFSSLLLGGLIAVDWQGFLLEPLRGLSLQQAFEVSWGLLLLGVLGVAGAMRGAGPVWRLRVMGLCLFAAAVYGLIAVGRTPLIGSLQDSPETLASTARYHYLAPMLLALILGLALARLCERPFPPASWRRAIAVGWLGVLVVASSQAMPLLRANLPAARRTQFTTAVEAIRREIAAAPSERVAILENHNFPGVLWGKNTNFFGCDVPIYAGRAALFVTAFPHDTVDGRRVYFVERNRRVRAAVEAMPGTRIDSLIIDPKRAAALRRSAP